MKAIRYLLLSAVLAGAVGCGGRNAGTSVVIGAAGPWQLSFGASAKRGIELAVAEVNQAGGIGGRPLKVEMRDDEASGSRAAQVAQEFVSNPAIVAVVGHVTSGAMVAAARVYDGQLPAVATSATSPDLTGISPWVFRVTSSDSTNGADMARFAARLGRTRAAVLYENDAYGRGLIDAFRRTFKGEIVSVDPVSGDSRDFEPYVARWRAVKPDIVVGAGTDATGIPLLREAKRQHLKAVFLGGDGWGGITADSAAAEGAYVAAPFTAADPRPEAQRFVAAYRAKYGVAPDGFAALAYDATMAVAEGVRRAGPDRVAVRNWLASLGDGSALKGVAGPIRFGPAGDPVGRGFVMTRVRGGEYLAEEAR